MVNETVICCGKSCDGAEGTYTYATIMTMICAILYIIGGIANSLAFVVLRLMKIRGSSILYLEVLAIADMINCLTAGMFGRGLLILSEDYPFEYVRYNRIYQLYFRRLYLYVDFIFQMTMTTSPWLLFALSIDRYIAIRFPLSAIQICTTQNALRVSISIWILTFIFEIPTLWDKETYAVAPNHPCAYVYLRNLLLLNKQYAMYYDFLFAKVLLLFVPGIIVLACNAHMYLLVQDAARMRRKLQQIDDDDKSNSTDSKQGRQITMTILVLNIIFTVEYMMSVINTFLPALLPEDGSKTWYRPYHSKQLLHAINSMINLFVYLGIRKGFGKTLVWFMSCHRLGKVM
ncbi:mu-type opioid receptor-like [Tubulanus polymorphus]|uniref:mu-type opioid receptor-like n=1 Tax=Tubulanus polymorphus TaxID=672921 RepID=UPI003DA534EB